MLALLLAAGDDEAGHDVAQAHLLAAQVERHGEHGLVGLRGGIFTASIPAPARTASNDAVNCPARSRIRNRKSAARSPRSIRRLRICCAVQGPSGLAVIPRMCT